MPGRFSGDVSEVELLGFLLGQDEESVLQVGDFAADLGGVEAVSVGDQVGLLGRGEHPCGQWPVQRRLWGIVEASAAAVGAAGIPDRFDGRGEVVEAVVDQLPHPVEHGAFLGGVIAVVERVLADQVVVLGLDGGLVVFLVRAKAGEVDTVVAGPADDRLVEKHGAVVEI